MLRYSTMRSACAAALLLLAAGAQAQDGAAGKMAEFARMAMANPPHAIQAPAIAPIDLAPSSHKGEIWESAFGQPTLRNVTQAALYPLLPAKGKANGTALIIAPGGAFLSLAFENEGMAVARYFAERGVACFVLAYRLEATPQDPRAFMQVVGKRFGTPHPGRTRLDPNESPAIPLAQEDGLAAIRYLRGHAGEFGIDAQRIGMIGFSAGGMTTMNVATAYDAASRPDFIGVIYGAAPQRAVPKDAPPAFIAMAADDPLLGLASVPIFEDWRAAGKRAELHVYEAGDHGFGMRKTGTTADGWIEQFALWMKVAKLLPR